MTTRDLVGEIEEIRQRQSTPYYPVVFPIRLMVIVRVFQSSPELHPEFLRYIPIGIVAGIEGFFRSAVKECIDAGGHFADNARHLRQVRDFRANFDILDAVHGQRISIGDLFAHLVSINGLEQIDAIRSTITGTKFLEQLTNVHSRWDVEIKGEPQDPIITEPDVVLRHVKEMFRLRHIYAHELTDSDKPDRMVLGEALKSSVSFLSAAEEVLGNLLHPNAPLTAVEMNRESAEYLADLDRKITAVFEKLSSLLDGDRRVLLRSSQDAWMEFRRQQAEYEAANYLGGTIYPVVLGGTAQAIAKERLEKLKQLLEDEKEGL